MNWSIPPELTTPPQKNDPFVKWVLIIAGTLIGCAVTIGTLIVWVSSRF